jgi:ubiquinone/menaquinone biosynthesis C-methylase UbiE
MQEQALYSKYKKGEHWKKHPEDYASSFSQFLNQHKFTGRIIDIGCGNGRDLLVFSREGLDAFGVDNNPSEIEDIKRKNPELDVRLQDAERLNIPDASIDAAYMINVIHYVDKRKAISEAYRILKPNGYFFVHFNLEIKDDSGRIDYTDTEENITKLVSAFKLVGSRKFKRKDSKPTPHTHQILELILQKA